MEETEKLKGRNLDKWFQQNGEASHQMDTSKKGIFWS